MDQTTWSMPQAVAATAVLLAALVAPAGGTAAGTEAGMSHPAVRDLKLENASPSIEDLVRRLLAALGANDREALHRLRVTDREYIDVILAGNVKPGEPLRQWPENVNRFFWNMLNDKSAAYEVHLLQTHGGRRYALESITWDKGTQQYAIYTAYKQIRLDLEGDDGKPAHLETGSIAEVNGQFKFVSFVRD
jgi:hypothetical protein